MIPSERQVRRWTVLRGLLAGSLLLCFLVSGLGLLAPGPALAQQARGYSENFDDGQAQGWDFGWWSEGGKWVVTDGRLIGRGPAGVLCTDCYRPRVPYTLRFELLALRGSLHVNVHVSRDDRLGIGFSYSGGDELGVYAIRGGENARRARVQVPFNLDAIVKESGGIMGATIAIVVAEGYTEVHVQGAEGNPVLVYKDPEPPRGVAFGFETLDDSYAVIDNLGIKQTEPEGPDLAVLSADRWHLEGDGQSVIFEVEIQNVGNAEAPGSEVWVGDPTRDWAAAEPVPGLAPGEVTVVPVRLEVPDDARGGVYQFLVEIDPEDRVGELNEENNRGETPEVEIPKPEPEGPDLAVLSADRWHLEGDGQSVVFEVEIQNVGNAGAPGSEVWVGDQTRDWAAAEPVPGLAPGEDLVVVVRLEVPDDMRGGAYRFLVKVDPEDRVGELNEENNRAETPVVEIPAPRPDGRWVLIIVVVVIFLGGLGYAGWRMWRGGPEEPPVPVAPLLVPVRLMNLWLTEGTSGAGPRLSDAAPLVKGGHYSFHLQVPEVTENGAMPEEAEDLAETCLSAVLFAPEEDFDFEFERRRVDTLRVPARGASNEFRCPFQPQRPGRRRLRACLYYGNVLVQSAYVDASVVESGEAPAGTAATARRVDYVASIDLAGLDKLPQPDLNLFTNQASDGTHWIGVYASDGETGLGLASGDTIALDPDKLDTMTQEVRKLLGEIEGLKERYSSYKYEKPLAEGGVLEVVWRKKDLIRLACQGSKLFENLLIVAGMEAGREKNLYDKLQRPGIISIARCRGERPSLPWAVLYEPMLDSDRGPEELSLCRFYQDELALRATEGAGQPGPGTDLLQDPQSCRERENCPLDGDHKDLTVCPFGFWGFLHQVEQPLQDIDPLPVGAWDKVPKEIGEARRNQTSRLVYGPSGSPEALMAVWPDFKDVEEHRGEITRLFTERGWEEPKYLADRNEILPLLQKGGKHLYYFFCHGEMQGSEFRLKLGPTANPGYISASRLGRRWATWPETPQPLVFLNGCETMALLPERIHLFAAALRNRGASGVVGTEIQVFEQLARGFGRRVLEEFLLQEKSLGEAFLEARRELMRDGNPLGLAYTCLAPATLHLHDEEKCAWCTKQGFDNA